MIALSSVVHGPTGGGNGGGSPVFLLIVGLLFMAVGAAQAANPRLMWRLNRWKYKNPEANEPSDTAFRLQRLGGGVFAIIGLVVVVVAITKF